MSIAIPPEPTFDEIADGAQVPDDLLTAWDLIRQVAYYIRVAEGTRTLQLSEVQHAEACAAELSRICAEHDWDVADALKQMVTDW